jgi:flagellar hook-associated protein 2
MAVDYISALNAGSGLNTTQIIDSLVDAERAPREAAIQEKIDDANIAISSIGELKSELSTFNSNVTALDGQTGIVLSSSSSSIIVEKIGTQPLTNFSHSVEVSALAEPQVIEFSGFSTSTDTVSLGTLTFTVGTWDDSVSSFSANSDYTAYSLDVSSASTIADVVALINNDTNATMDGIQASILQTDDGAYSLVIKSHFGSDRELQIVDSAGSTFEFSSNADSDHQISGGVDATLSIDGISIKRNTNVITDLIDDMSITIDAVTTTQQTISAEYDETSALETMQTFVDELNFVISFLEVQTAYGKDGGEDGALAGDPFATQLQSYVRNMTSSAIEGYGANPLYLSYFGVLTNLDGSLSLDTQSFKEYYAIAPENFSAVTQSSASTSNSLVDGSVYGDSFTPGSYSFAITDSTTATVTDEDGVTTSLSDAGGIFIASSGNATGLNLTSTSSSTSGTAYVGRSITKTITNYFSSILASNGDIDDKLDLLATAKVDYAADLTDLDDRMKSQRENYQTQFSAMEGTVASFKKTGDFMTNFMESWRAGL